MKTSIKTLLVLLFVLIVPIGGLSTPLAAAQEQPLELPPAGALEDFELTASHSGWALMGGRIFTTQDMGNTWQDITPPRGAGYEVSAVDFIDPVTGWAVLQATARADNESPILVKTVDGGLTWIEHPLVLFSQTPAFLPAEVSLHFLNAQFGWINIKHATSSNFSIGTLLVTEDGGDSWVLRNAPSGEPVTFSSGSTGWGVDNRQYGSIFRTDDAGITWQSLDLYAENEIQAAYFSLPVFKNEFEGVLPVSVTAGNLAWIDFWYSRDGGINWDRLGHIPQPSISEGNIPLSFIGGDRWLSVIPGSGETWQIDLQDDPAVQVANFKPSPGTWKMAAFAAQDNLGNYEVWVGRQTVEHTVTGVSQRSQLALLAPASARWVNLELPLSGLSTVGLIESASENETISAPSLSRTLAVTGQGFDKCEIPSLARLQDWATFSPYLAVNLYFGGIGRSCPNTGLTLAYLTQLSDLGWKFIPTWVGPQAPCTSLTYRFPLNKTLAFQAGVDEANAAVEKASLLGLTDMNKTGTVIYYDMEIFNLSDTACLEAAKSFVSGWSLTVRGKGNLAGLYAAGDFISQTNSIANRPDVIWPANWLIPSQYRPEATVWYVNGLSNTLWPNHQRIRQYAGSHSETWGSNTIPIDSDVIDGVVADFTGKFLLSVAKNVNNNSLITSSQVGIICGSDCLENYANGEKVTLSIKPAPGDLFLGWSANCTPTGAFTCQVAMNTKQIVRAFFPKDRQLLPWIRNK